MTRVGFGEELFKPEFSSALLYKLQKKESLEFNDQSNADSIFAEDTSTNVQLLIIWRYNNECEVCVRSLLVKHSNIITWDEDTLDKLYSMYLFLCKDDNIIEDTWLLNDATVLITTSKWKGESREFEIIISEGTRKDGTMEPLWISLDM
jgi:hypothetical protein